MNKKTFFYNCLFLVLLYGCFLNGWSLDGRFLDLGKKIDGHFADFGQVKIFNKTPLANWMPKQSLLFTYGMPRHLDSAFEKNENYYRQVLLKRCKYIKKKLVKHIHDNLSYSSYSSDESDDSDEK